MKQLGIDVRFVSCGSQQCRFSLDTPRLMRIHNEESDKDLKRNLACRTPQQILPD